MRRRGLSAGVAAAIAAAIVGGFVASRGDSSSPRLTVFAASSLADVLPRIDSHARYSFGGSNALAAQIRQGLPADVIASANTGIPAALHRDGLVEKPVRFTANALVVVVRKGNPAHLRRVRDLERPGLKVVLAAAGVPAGDYARTVLRRLGLGDLVRRAASQETDVREVLSKVALGEADAGFVYATDARAFRGRVAVLPIPARAQPRVVYAAAVVRASAHRDAAEAWVERLRGRAAQAALRAAGFR